MTVHRFLTPMLAAGAVLVAAGPAMAQTELRPGEYNRAIFEENTCFVLVTTPGERWSIETTIGHARATLEIGTGFNCDGGFNVLRSEAARTSFPNFWGIPAVNFTAGGGHYLIRMKGDGSAYTTGLYAVKPQRSRGRSGEPPLPPGLVSLTVTTPAGSASQGSPGQGRSAGDTFRDCPSCPQVTVIAPGSFMMGSPDDEDGRTASEGPRHVVTPANGFGLGSYEVTFDEYDACVADAACAAVQDGGWGRGRRPVINVSYLDARRYVGWLSQKTGQSYFLPSEAEWEYAARAGSDTPWNTGAAIIGSDANILNQFGKTTPVGGFAANAFGLFDMHGNVAEWTQDCIDTGYVGAPTDGSVASGGDCNAQAVVRGGSHASLPAEVRSAARHGVSRDVVSGEIGFRVARAL